MRCQHDVREGERTKRIRRSLAFDGTLFVESTRGCFNWNREAHECGSIFEHGLRKRCRAKLVLHAVAVFTETCDSLPRLALFRWPLPSLASTNIHRLVLSAVLGHSARLLRHFKVHIPRNASTDITLFKRDKRETMLTRWSA